jgi:hypothetical protein
MLIWVNIRLELSGADIGAGDPYASHGTPSYVNLLGSAPLYGERGNPLDVGGGCSLDGMAISCSEAARMVNGGSAVPDGNYFEPYGNNIPFHRTLPTSR